MALRYHTDEEIHRVDRVTYGGTAGVIELVVEGLTGEPEEDWFFETNGAGIMSPSRKCSGTFTSTIPMRTRTFCLLREGEDPRGAMASTGARGVNDGTS
jgi:hypothetical protein